MFDSLTKQPADELLALIKEFRNDPRTDKLDLGVGVYRDENGNTPVMRAIKSAEESLVREQRTKSYLGPEGDLRYVDLLQPIVFGAVDVAGRIAGIQTPGGGGALRAAGDLIHRARPHARIWMSAPTWPNHAPVFETAGLHPVTYPYFDIATQRIEFDQMIRALSSAISGDVVLLHGACHNPTGADLDHSQWETVITLCAERGLLPLFDLAYQGLGEGLDEDAYGVRTAATKVEEMIVAQSCDKNFALYRERTGTLYVLGRNVDIVSTNLAACARATWSMPPDHGAATVRLVLESPELTGVWRKELDEMRHRINAVRQAVSEVNPALSFIGSQRGLFSNLRISPEKVLELRTKRGVYMAKSGRINLAGLRISDAAQFSDALHSVGWLVKQV